MLQIQLARSIYKLQAPMPKLLLRRSGMIIVNNNFRISTKHQMKDTRYYKQTRHFAHSVTVAFKHAPQSARC
jgi:hypothetical protein